MIADDMGLDASRSYSVGGLRATMPNIEAICDTGLVFQNAYAAPVEIVCHDMTGEFTLPSGETHR